MNDKSSTFEGVIDLRGMETQSGHIAPIQYALASHFNAESMCCIVDYLKTILIGNFLNSIHLDRLTIAMYWHDGCGLGGDGCLDLIGVDAAGLLFDIDKHRLAAIPPDAVGGGHETIGSGNHLTRDTQCLKSRQQWKRTIGEQTDIWHFKILGQCCFQLLVKLAIVRYPFARPYFLEHLVKLIKIGQQGRGDGYLIIHLI